MELIDTSLVRLFEMKFDVIYDLWAVSKVNNISG